MKRRHYRDIPGCPVEVTLDLIDGRWKGVVLHHLLAAGCLRFNELRRRLPGITQRLLTKQLRELEAAGLVDRQLHAAVPPRVEYRPTAEGESLRPLLAFAEAWGRERLARAAAAPPAARQDRAVAGITAKPSGAAPADDPLRPRATVA